MLEHAIYSVISPEGCASILWRDASRAEHAAAGHEDHGSRPAGLGLVDEMIEEPSGGAHVNHEQLFKSVDDVLSRQLQRAWRDPDRALVEARYHKFRAHGSRGSRVHAGCAREDGLTRARRPSFRAVSDPGCRMRRGPAASSRLEQSGQGGTPGPSRPRAAGERSRRLEPAAAGAQSAHGRGAGRGEHRHDGRRDGVPALPATTAARSSSRLARWCASRATR